MAAAILNKKQQQKTLTGKKAKRETIKNVLATRYTNHWPLIKVEDNDHLIEMLEKYLPRIQYDKIPVPWKEIKNIPKNNRKKFRESYNKCDRPPINPVESEGLILGVNNVSILLEKNQAQSIMIASDVQPRLMVQHITDQAVLYNTPLIVVTNLREILKKQCGVSSSTVALSKNIKPNTKLSIINQTILNIAENYPVPKDHINYDRRQEMFNIADDTIDLISEASVMEIGSETVMEVSPESVIEIDSDDDDSKKGTYLYRKMKTERTFIPERSKIITDTVRENVTGIPSGFLAFTIEEAAPVNNCDARLYKSLVVKRLKGNKNRNKRKLDELKELG